MQINSFQYYLPVNLIFGPGKTEVRRAVVDGESGKVFLSG